MIDVAGLLANPEQFFIAVLKFIELIDVLLINDDFLGHSIRSEVASCAVHSRVVIRAHLYHLILLQFHLSAF